MWWHVAARTSTALALLHRAAVARLPLRCTRVRFLRPSQLANYPMMLLEAASAVNWQDLLAAHDCRRKRGSVHAIKR
jgi:hypothetical protein